MLMGRANKEIYIDCVERDKETYEEASKDPILKNKNISLYKGDVFQFMDWFSHRQYDMIWLDLCANMTVNLIQQVCKVVCSDRIARNSYLAVTFMGSREHHDLLKLFQVERHEEIRKDKFPEIVINAARLSNRVCKLVKLHRYKNTNTKAAPMLLYVFKIETL